MSKGAARATVHFVADEVGPADGCSIPEMLSAIAKRYQFETVPKTSDATPAAGARFVHGHFAFGNRDIFVGEMEIHDDSLSVTTTDTQDSELVLNELLEWLVATLNFRRPRTPFVRAYQSDLTVEFDAALDRAFADLQPLTRLIERFRQKAGQEPKDVQFNRFAIGSDSGLPGPSSEFMVERHPGMPWKSSRYLAKAHLPTDEHVRALQLFEKLLTRVSLFPWT